MALPFFILRRQMCCVLGYDCDQVTPDESEGSALELMARFREYAKRHGVNLEREAQNLRQS